MSGSPAELRWGLVALLLFIAGAPCRSVCCSCCTPTAPASACRSRAALAGWIAVQVALVGYWSLLKKFVAAVAAAELWLAWRLSLPATQAGPAAGP